MIITLIIYSLIILYVILRGFSTSIKKPLCNVQKIESFQNSISLDLMPFYSNMGIINLFAFVINFFIISFISISLLPDLISNNIAYCQDEDQSLSLYSDNNDNGSFYFKNDKKYKIKWGQFEEKDIYATSFGLLKKYINNTYKISNQEKPFIFHLNYKNVSIYEPLKMRVFEGLTEDFDNILKKQEKLIQKISNIDEKSYKINEVKYIYKEIYKKNNDMLYLTSNAYNKIISDNSLKNYSDELLIKIFNKDPEKTIRYFNADINKNIRGFINNDHCFNQKALNTFISLEKIKYLSKENYDLLKQIENPRIRINPDIPLIKKVYLSDKLQVSINSNLNSYCEENVNILRGNRIENSLGIIDSFYSKFLEGHYFKEEKNILSVSSIQDMGFSCPHENRIFWYMNSVATFFGRPHNSDGYGYEDYDSPDSIERNNNGWDD